MSFKWDDVACRELWPLLLMRKMLLVFRTLGFYPFSRVRAFCTNRLLGPGPWRAAECGPGALGLG